MAENAPLVQDDLAAVFPWRSVRPLSKLITGFLIGLGVWRWEFASVAATNPPSGEDIPDLRPPKALIPPSFWEQHSTAVVILSILGLILLCLAIWLILRPRAPLVIPPEVQARQALETLRQQPEDGLVLSRVSQILRHYLAAAFALPPGEMTTTEFCAALTNSPRVGPQLSVPIVEFLRACDQRKFAPTPPQPPQNAVEKSFRFIELSQARLSALQLIGPVRASTA